MADSNVVIPAVEQVLADKGGNAADQITANEAWYDFPLGMLIVPEVLAACSNWTVSGDALNVGPLAQSDPSKAAQPGPTK
jgi:hypothetical protein